ncbi:MAG: hypothetical protein N2117_12795 [Anaerolineales bacterium]|nr:hypothetical protein [Anaerolineales bacterium]
MKKIVSWLVMVLVASLLLVAHPRAKALGTISCGTPPVPSGGSLTCEAGAGYVRWTFSDVPRVDYQLSFALSDSQPAKAMVKIALEHGKQPVETNYSNGYVVTEYRIGQPAVMNYYRYSFLGPSWTPEGGGGDSFRESLNWYVVLNPGAGLTFDIARKDLPVQDPEKITGTVTVELLADEPDWLASKPAFLCNTATLDETQFAPQIPTTNIHPQYAEMPDSVQCVTGANYIEWHFSDAARMDLPLSYLLRKELMGMNAVLEYDLTLCNPGFGDDGVRQDILSIYGIGQPDFLEFSGIEFPGQTCGSDSGTHSFTFPNEISDSYRSAELRFWGGFALGGKERERFPMNGWVRISVPGWNPTETPTPTGTVTGTPTLTLTPTLQPSPTSSEGGGGGGGGGGNPPPPTQPPPPTATFTRTFTPTATNTATRTATVTPTATRTSTATATPTFTPTATGGGGGSGTSTPIGGGTGTPIVITATPSPTPVVQTATPSFTPAVYSPTPNWQATQTAMALTQTALAWTATPGAMYTATPNWGATMTALAATATPNWGATMTAQAGTPVYHLTMTAMAWTPTPYGGGGSGTPQTPGDFTSTPVPVGSGSSGSNATATPRWSSGGGGGASSGDGQAAAGATPTILPQYLNGLYGMPNRCSAYVRVLVYVDANKDNLMALKNEGVEDVMVYLVNADYEVLNQARTRNGLVKFCVPSDLAGQTVYVDIPYLLRSGMVQLPRRNNSGQDYGANPLGGVAAISTLETIFRLEPPEFPLYIP